VRHRHVSLDIGSKDDARRDFAAWLDHQAQLKRWLGDLRSPALRLIAARTAVLKWSPALLKLLLEELFVGDFFIELIGIPERIPERRYAQAVAVAVAPRHSWRRSLSIAPSLYA
jgi:hypothetical protein